MVNEYDIVIEEGIACPISVEEIEADCNLVLSEEGVERPCTVSISIVSDEEIQQVNLEWREKNAPTDVISLEVERPDDPDLAPGEMCELGDIILAPNFIARQAKEYGTTEADEFRLMLVHAMRHLLGCDHIEDDEAEVMEAREDSLVALLSTDRTIEPVVLTRHREGIDE